MCPSYVAGSTPCSLTPPLAAVRPALAYTARVSSCSSTPSATKHEHCATEPFHPLSLRVWLQSPPPPGDLMPTTAVVSPLPVSHHRLLCFPHDHLAIASSFCRSSSTIGVSRSSPWSRCSSLSRRHRPSITGAAARHRCAATEPHPLVSYRAKSPSSTFRCCGATLTPSSACKT
jgi:hypothetical protein